MAFRRALGTFDATMLVVGGIIGAGIFVNPYLVAQRLPSAGPILWVWIAGGAIALAGALPLPSSRPCIRKPEASTRTSGRPTIRWSRSSSAGHRS